MFEESGNATFPPEDQKPSMFRMSVTYIALIVIILAVFLDLCIIMAYVRRPRLLTAFNVHILLLTVQELLCAVLANPIVIQQNLSRNVYMTNPAHCSYQKYIEWTFGSLMLLQHDVICLDRWLALLRPSWYRTKTARFGVTATLCAFVYQQTWYLPLFVAEMMREIVPDSICRTTVALPAYQLVVRIATHFLPELFVFLSYPMLLWRVWKLRKTRFHRLKTVRRGSRIEGQQRSSTGSGSAEARNLAVIYARTASIDLPLQLMSSRRTHDELQLTLWLLILQIVFWMPPTVATVLRSINSALDQDLFNLALLLPCALLLIDPLVYLIFLKNVRNEIFGQFKGFLQVPCVRRVTMI
ncbi:hypothetical protein BV898_12823 [Hypsibius exemplaris]|uniref:G-protein coupled receptors family 1 profile domain-containing protein n=1 Tax=Hypsibius exemplaris TaxID=2072580 RepID=A0A1W0WCG8_HYPEX|nr:hypothetical protein BV898_12823 [Hypsibius exemplaris]